MGDGLLDMLGLGDSKPQEPASEAQAESSSVFRDAVAAVNESLQSVITKATPEEHAALNADRAKLCEAYQVASSQYGQDESAGQAAMDRVIAAAGALGGKAADSAQNAAAAREKWNSQEERFDEMALQVNELAEAGHEKSSVLQQVCQTIREKVSGNSYGESASAVDELGPKLEAIMDQHNAMIAEAQAPQQKEESGNWWDKAKDAMSDAYDWTTGEGDKSQETARSASDANDSQYTEGEEEKDLGDGDGRGDGDMIGAGSATLNVQIEFSDGNPASGAPLFCDGEGGKQVYVNDAGSASVKLPPGAYTVRSLWGNSKAQAGSTITLAAGEVKSVTLVLSTGATLQVQVRWADYRAAVAGATVQVTGSKTASGQTDGSGMAIIADLPPGSYQVALTAGVADADGGLTANVELAVGELTTITLTPSGAKSGAAAKVASLMSRSKEELALKSQLQEVGHEEADNYADYNHTYDDVAGYLSLAKKGHEFTEEQLTWWSKAIGELSAFRRAIAGGRASGHWQEQKIAAANRVTGLKLKLANQRTSLGKIQKAFQNAGNMQEGVSAALELNDKLSTLESILSFAADPSKLQAIDSGISELVNQVDPTGDAINRHVATLAGYVKKQAAELEGYESLESLVSQIGVTVSAIRTAVHELNFYDKKYKEAVALEGAKGGFE